MVYLKKTLYRCFFTFILIFLTDAQGESKVTLGIENLISNHKELIQGKKVGLIINHTSTDSKGKPILDLIKPYAKVAAIFAPEHGFSGNESAGKDIKDEVRADIRIYSLYGDFKQPTAEMLKGIDLLIFDMQDVGVKFYTYISTLYLSLLAAQRNSIPILVLDRPNLIRGDRTEGAITYPVYSSFVGPMPLPMRYGMTIGELATLMNQEKLLGNCLNAQMMVVEMQNYKRTMRFEDMELPWIDPSPNIPTIETARIYPGTCLIEGTNLSEGRGTEAPFVTIGAPFITAENWLKTLPEELKSGVEIKPVTFTPKNIPGKAENPKHLGKECHGLRIHITDPDKIRPIELTVALLCGAQQLYPKDFKILSRIDSLWGNQELRAMIQEGINYRDIMQTTVNDLYNFIQVRKNYLRYN